MRVRARFAKTGKLRFVSAIDLGRLFERALRKADLPIAYSEGFSPHPKVSFPDALGLGYASVGEYCELTFAVPVDVDSLVERLSAAFPVGVHLVHAIEVAEGERKLASLLNASAWDMAWGPESDPSALAEAADGLLAADNVMVERPKKDRVDIVDARPPIHTCTVTDRTIRVLIRHVEPPLRPTEVRAALDAITDDRGGRPLGDPVLVTRLAQGSLVDDGLVEALSGELIPAAASIEEPHPT